MGVPCEMVVPFSSLAQSLENPERATLALSGSSPSPVWWADLGQEAENHIAL